jgi:predicted 3-demethylubiquinone-9 3-methyltransferase (glyoxalase superfamily)
MKIAQKITPFLWFENQAEEAVNLYTSLFSNSKIHNVVRYGKGGPGPEGEVMTISFELEGQQFAALNGNPQFMLTEAFSFVVNCESQAEVDKYWNALIADGGEESMCGWLKDKFGLSWQIIPTVLMQMIQDKDPEKAKRVMQAMMQMRKIEISVLQKAYDNK